MLGCAIGAITKGGIHVSPDFLLCTSAIFTEVIRAMICLWVRHFLPKVVQAQFPGWLGHSSTFGPFSQMRVPLQHSSHCAQTGSYHRIFPSFVGVHNRHHYKKVESTSCCAHDSFNRDYPRDVLFMGQVFSAQGGPTSVPQAGLATAQQKGR